MRQIEQALTSENDDELMRGIANLIKGWKRSNGRAAIELGCIDEEAGGAHDPSIVNDLQRVSIHDDDDLESQADVGTDRKLLPLMKSKDANCTWDEDGNVKHKNKRIE